MTQEQINKLQELKQLLDAGILTQEEMQAEKAKILGTSSQPMVDSKPTQPQSNITEERPNDKSTVGSSESGNNTNKTKRNIILAIAAIVVIGLFIYAITSKDEPKVTQVDTEVYSYENGGVDVGPAPVDETNNTEESSTDDDEFGLDPWNGSLNIVGDIYRTCSTLAYITLNKTGKGMYNGTMELMLGDADIDIDTGAATGKFFDDQGHLKGNLRAKAEGQTLTIVLDSYSITKPSEFFDDLSKGQQIFRLTYDGQTYTAQAVGKMQSFFYSIEIK